jgi:uncharacterized membrane protein YvbJ
MKCESCGAELADGAKTCAKCGHEVGLGHRAGAETEHVAHEAGEGAKKVGRGILGGAKGLVSGAKKEFHKSDDEEQKDSS